MGSDRQSTRRALARTSTTAGMYLVMAAGSTLTRTSSVALRTLPSWWSMRVMIVETHDDKRSARSLVSTATAASRTYHSGCSSLAAMSLTRPVSSSGSMLVRDSTAPIRLSVEGASRPVTRLETSPPGANMPNMALLARGMGVREPALSPALPAALRLWDEIRDQSSISLDYLLE